MLNPPYKADKRRDAEELEFVAGNLRCLHPGGVCVAIVPMQSALSQQGRIADWKRELLSKHTLDAVCSMPNELFFNSKVGVVSCVMVFTAHKPHPRNKKVFLGYFKDDGFKKLKIGGRQDADGRWEGIKQRWLEHYLNRRSAPGLSVNVALGADDEWVPEVFMETDYSLAADDLFEQTLHDYSTYLFRSRRLRLVSDDSIEPKYTRLRDPSAWRRFPLTDLFTVSGTTTTPPRDLAYCDPGSAPYVTTQATNNGVGGFYAHATEEGGVVTVDSAVAGYSAFQSGLLGIRPRREARPVVPHDAPNGDVPGDDSQHGAVPLQLRPEVRSEAPEARILAPALHKERRPGLALHRAVHRRPALLGEPARTRLKPPAALQRY